jgi:hypothetical protein
MRESVPQALARIFRIPAHEHRSFPDDTEPVDAEFTSPLLRQSWYRAASPESAMPAYRRPNAPTGSSSARFRDCRWIQACRRRT